MSSAPHHRLLWQRAKSALAIRGAIPAGHPTPSEIAEHAGGILGSDLVRRFVEDYYNGREHDEGRSKLTHEQAEQIVASLETMAAGRAAQPPPAPGKAVSSAAKAASPSQHYEVQADLDEAVAFGAAEAAAAREKREALRIQEQKAETARQLAEQRRQRVQDEERRREKERLDAEAEQKRIEKEKADAAERQRLRELERAKEEELRKAREAEQARLLVLQRAQDEERRREKARLDAEAEQKRAEKQKADAAERQRLRERERAQEEERERQRIRQEALNREAVERADEERRKADHASQNRIYQAAKWAELGHECSRKGDFSGAVTSFENALEWDPGNASAQQGLAAVRAARSERPRDMPQHEEVVEVVDSEKRERKDETDADSGDKDFVEFFLGFIVGGGVLGLTYWLSENGLTLYPKGFMTTKDGIGISFWLFYLSSGLTLLMVRDHVGGGTRSLGLYLRTIGWFCAMSLILDPIVVRVLLHTPIDPLGWGFWLRFPLLAGATILIVTLRTRRA